MAVTFKDLLEGTDLADDVKTNLWEAWEAKLSEAREDLTAELREEFAQRYEQDKSKIVGAVDSFISEKVTAEISELAEEREQLVQDRVKYRKAISEHAKLLDTFVTKVVATEVKELRADKDRVSEHVAKLDEFVTEQLACEIAEFHEDKKALVEQKVKMVREGKRQLVESKRKFIKNASANIQKVVGKVITNEVRQLRGDITKARENDFGRRIFEAYASEYGTSYLNESKDLKTLQKTLSDTEQRLAEAVEAVNSKEESAKLTESKLRIAEDRYARKEKLNSLLGPLGKEKKEIMLDLLESHTTAKLESAFDKYLPSVLGGDVNRVKKTLSESVKKEHTGDKAPVQAEASDEPNNVVDLDYIKKLAGI